MKIVFKYKNNITNINNIFFYFFHQRTTLWVLSLWNVCAVGIIWHFLPWIQSALLRRGPGGLCEDTNEIYSGTFGLQTSFPRQDKKCGRNISTLTDSFGRKRCPDARRNRKGEKKNWRRKKVPEGGGGRRTVSHFIKL